MSVFQTKTKSVVASAPGKVILTGEHFVVHGSYAVAAAINKRARVMVSSSGGLESEIISKGVTSPVQRNDGLFKVVKSVVATICREYGRPQSRFRVQIDSDIPEGSGLGSSAAIAVATSAALLAYLGQKKSNDLVMKLAAGGEKIVHGNPSGIDTQASLSGGVFLFNKENGAKAIRIHREVKLLVVFSGKSRTTGRLVSKVKGVRSKHPASFKHLSQAASLLSIEAAHALTRGDLPQLGSLMDLSQLSLSWIGVSTRELDSLIECLRTADTFGVKITGAGGGGSIIALPKPDGAKSLLEKISLKYSHSFLTSIPQEGLRWEKQYP